MENNIIQKIIEQKLADNSLIYPFIADLSNRDKAILTYRRQGKPLSFIGKKLGITRERVRQLEAKAERKLEYQKEIIAQVVIALKEYLFTENEIEAAFFEWQKSQPIGKTKMHLVDFNKALWQLKQEKK